MTIEMPRRRFLAGMIGLVAAPAVIRVAALMPVKAIVDQPPYRIVDLGAVRCDLEFAAWIKISNEELARVLGMAAAELGGPTANLVGYRPVLAPRPR